MSLSKVSQGKVEMLNGKEINAVFTYEGAVVGVKGREVYSHGKVIDTLDTDEKVELLYEEYVQRELIWN